MGYASNLVTAPVGVRDVQRALGNGSPDVGTLCIAPSINKWAKYKPVKFAKVGILTSENLTYCNYGIVDIPTWGRLSYASTFLFSTNRASLQQIYWPDCDREKGSVSVEYWVYQRPTGGSSSPYRLADFNNYFHAAEVPIGPMPQNLIKIDPSGSLRIPFTKGAASSYTLALSDLKWPGSATQSIGDMYFGVLMRQTSGSITSSTYVATQKSGNTDITMSQALEYGYWVDIPTSVVEATFAGTWKIFPIISNIPIAATTEISQQDGNRFIAPLPYHDQAISIEIEYAEIIFTAVHGYKDLSSQQRYARFNFNLQSLETTAGRVRNYRIEVTLCDAQGNKLNNYTGGSQTGQITTNDSGTATGTVQVSAYIAQIWNSAIYFRAELTISDTLEFKRTSTWSLTGPIQEESVTPSQT